MRQNYFRHVKSEMFIIRPRRQLDTGIQSSESKLLHQQVAGVPSHEPGEAAPGGCGRGSEEGRQRPAGLVPPGREMGGDGDSRGEGKGRRAWELGSAPCKATGKLTWERGRTGFGGLQVDHGEVSW